MSVSWIKIFVNPFLNLTIACTYDLGCTNISILLYSKSNIFFASITSKTLFIIVAESIDIFFPIFQLGCFNAFLGVIFVNLFNGKWLKGPPDAVIKIFSISLLFILWIRDQIEKCSESIGMNFVLFLFNAILINGQPQIIDSLFAIAMFLVYLIISSVGFKPSIPTNEFIV